MSRSAHRFLFLLLLLLLPLAGWAQGPRATSSISTLQNDTTTGTTLNQLAKIVPGPNALGKLVNATAADTGTDLYVVIANAGTTGEGAYVVVGETSCVFDATNASGKAGKYVVISPTAAPKCHVQDNPPTNGIVVGKLIDDTTTVNQLSRMMALNQAYVPGNITGSGGVSSVGMTMPPSGEFLVTPATITTSGTFAITEATQAANTAYMGPASGAAATPGYRAFVAADVSPALAGVTMAGDLSGPLTTPTVLKASSTFALVGEDSPTQLSGDIANYGGCTKVACRINGGALDRRITGLTGGTPGALLDICNVGTTNSLILPSQYTGTPTSTDTNRFLFVDDVTVPAGECHAVRYDGPTARWRSFSAAVPNYLNLKPIGVIVGDPDSGSPDLVVGNDTPEGFVNRSGRDMEVRTLACKTNAGQVTINPVLTGGSATSILTGTGKCACVSTGWTNCTVQSGTSAPVVKSYTGAPPSCGTPPCSIDFNIDTIETAAKYLNISGTALLK